MAVQCQQVYHSPVRKWQLVEQCTAWCTAGTGLLLSFSRLTNSFDPESLTLTLKADSDLECVISDLDLP